MRQAAKYVKIKERARQAGMEGKKREREGPIIIKMDFQKQLFKKFPISSTIF